jgi:LemA protein
MGIVLLILIALTALIIFFFNQLTQNRILVQEGWSGIDVQLKRRHDLIPNLVESVKGYMQHEREVLENVTRLRNQVMTASAIKEKGPLENDISKAIKTIFAVAENYPNLKADQAFLSLQKDLTAIEDELQLARRYYNGTVRNYNIAAASLPGNIIAGIFHFSPADFFQLDSSDEGQTPQVNLSK